MRLCGSQESLEYAEKKLKDLNIAYSILSDPVRKAEYDASQREVETPYQSTQDHNTTPPNKKTNKNSIVSYATTYADSIRNIIQNHSNKSSDERSKDLKALGITFVIMVILIILFWKVPFLRNILFP